MARAREMDPAAPVPGRKPEPPKRPQLQLLPPVDNPVIRNDPAGAGHFGASRGRGKRTHKGIDILAEPGTEVRTPISGTVNLGRVYGPNHPLAGKFDRIWIDSEDGTRIKMFYVEAANLVNGQTIKAGELVGRMQDRAQHDKGMKNHLHVEVHRDGLPIDPTEFIHDWFSGN